MTMRLPSLRTVRMPALAAVLALAALPAALALPAFDDVRTAHRPSDLRVLEQAWHEGHARARLAIKTFVHRIARHIAGHAAALQRLDGIIFTGGIGENSVLIRRLVSERLAVFGLAMDAARNQQPNSAGERLISADGSRVRCAVIPTNEERMIALDAIRLGRIHTAAALA